MPATVFATVKNKLNKDVSDGHNEGQFMNKKSQESSLICTCMVTNFYRGQHGCQCAALFNIVISPKMALIKFGFALIAIIFLLYKKVSHSSYTSHIHGALSFFVF